MSTCMLNSLRESVEDPKKSPGVLKCSTTSASIPLEDNLAISMFHLLCKILLKTLVRAKSVFKKGKECLKEH